MTKKKQEDVFAYIKDRLAEKYEAIKFSWRVLRKGELLNIYWRRPGGEQCLLNIRTIYPTTQCNLPEDLCLHVHRCHSLISRNTK